MADMNGRYGGGQAGPENRHHFPAADTARKDEAKEGKTDTSKNHRSMPERLPESKLNTLGAQRGASAGKQLPKDRGGF